MLEPRYNEALEFLRRWNDERWVLTSIEPDQKRIETRTFHPSEETAALEWLETQGVSRNLYFHVNPVLRDLSTKARREDVAALAWLHVDVDPRPGEDLAEERKRALRLLEKPPGGLPLPTAIVFSGGGYQGFWRLSEPLRIDGDLARAEEAKRWNLQLEILFGGDNCHNVDRIMRLPGTINRPNARKRRKGQEEALSRLVTWRDVSYVLSDFTPAPAVQRADEGFSGASIQVSGNVERLGSVDELPEGVPDWVKVLIVQGEDPDDPTRHESRSEALFAVCCALVRAGCDDDLIYSVITDPDFVISSSVLEKGGSAERYAVRQIERAREEAVDPWLRKLNEAHAVISDVGGKCRVISEVHDHALGRPRISQQSFEDFRNRYRNRKIQVGTTPNGEPIFRKVGHWWLDHEKRRQYDTIVFAPGREVEGAYNLWRGFACEAKPGECGKFFDHVLDNVCDGNEEYFEYLVGWMAFAVQKPDSPGHTAIVMRGKQGTGKSFFAKTFGSLWGRHFFHVSDPKFLVGSFNAHLRDCVVLFGDEAFYAGDKKHESILKMLITEETITVEAKGVDAEASANCVHLLMASNDDWVVPAGTDDRRFFVLDVSKGRARDGAYFRAIQDQMNAGGREALLHELLTRDISRFDVRRPPATTALQQQKEYSLGTEADWWFSKLREGRLRSADGEWSGEVLTLDLLYDFAQYTRNFSAGRRSNSTRLGHFLSKACSDGYPRLKQRSIAVEAMMLDGSKQAIKRPYFWVFPTLKECREHWDAEFGGPYNWPVPEIVEDEGEVF